MRYDSIIAIIVVSIVFPACHVSKSYSVVPFFSGWEEEKQGGKFDKGQKVQH